MFQDITTLLLDHKAFKDTVDIFVDRYRGMNISVVAGFLLLFFLFSFSLTRWNITEKFCFSSLPALTDDFSCFFSDQKLY